MRSRLQTLLIHLAQDVCKSVLQSGILECRKDIQEVLKVKCTCLGEVDLVDDTAQVESSTSE